MDELEALLRRTRAGDRRALNELGRWLDIQLNTFFSQHELTQRTALDLLEKLSEAPLSGPAFNDMMLGFAWIEIRQWRAERAQARKRRAWAAEHAEVQAPRHHLDELFASAEGWELTEQLLEQLSTIHREVLVARMRGYSYKTIAAVFGIKPGTARARVRAAKLRIADQWEQQRVTKTTFRTTKEAS